MSKKEELIEILDTRPLKLLKESKLPNNTLAEKYIFPLNHQRDKGYCPIFDDKLLSMWAPDYAHYLDDEYSKGEFMFQTEWTRFGNALSYPISNDKKENKPSNRIINPGFIVLTIEFDNNPKNGMALKNAGDDAIIDSLYHQWQWIKPKYESKPRSSMLADFDSSLQEFRDYRGVTAVYTGGKGFHFHFVFSTKHLDTDLCRKANGANGDGRFQIDLPKLATFHSHRWNHLLERFSGFFNAIGADTGFASTVQLRRLPWGIRRHQNPNALGLMEAIQVPVADHIREREPKGATEWFFNFHSYMEACSNHNPYKVHDIEVDPDQIANNWDKFVSFCETEFNSEFPKPVKISDQTIYFQNNIEDINPSSWMHINHKRIKLIPSSDTEYKLSMTPATFFQMCGVPVDDDFMKLNQREFFFHKDAISVDKIREKQGEIIPRFVRSNHKSIIYGPEGSGKTSSLFKCIPEWKRKGLLMFAALSYEQAASKVGEFNRFWEGKHKAKLIYSFSYLYKLFSPVPISYVEALQYGYSSVIEYCIAEEPRVYQQIMKERQTISVGDIVFVVQASACNWMKSKLSRAWLHSNWNDDMIEDGSWEVLLKDLGVSYLIYDEATASDFCDVIDVESANIIKRIHKNPLWSSTNTFDKLKAYGEETLHGEKGLVSFDKCLDVEFVNDIDVAVNWESTRYGKDNSSDKEKQIYKGMDGKRYVVIPRRWWTQIKGVVIFTTTERVTTDIASKMNIATLKLIPNIAPDIIPVITSAEVSDKKVGELATSIRKEFGDVVLVGNHLRGIEGSISFEKTKGSNDFKHRNMISFIGYKGPKEFAELSVIGQAFDIKEIMAWSDIDKLFQSIGRNSGLRNEGFKHAVFIKPELWIYIKSRMNGNQRYELLSCNIEIAREWFKS